MDKRILCPVLIGRDSEREELDQLLAATHAGESQMVLVAGEAGVGKSRLAAETKKSAAAQGFLVLEGSCFKPDRSCPNAPLLDLLRNHFGGYTKTEITTQIGSFTHGFHRLLPELVHPPSAPSSQPTLAPEQEKRRLFSALVTFFGRRAQAQPLLLLVEDLHWSDDTSLAFLQTLARRSTAQPLLLLATYRSDEVHPTLADWLAQLEKERLARQLRLQPLSRPQVEAMLGAIPALEHPLRHEFVDALTTLTGGNPFFVEEVLSSLVQSGKLAEVQDDAGHRPLQSIPIPHTVEEAVRSRLDQLSEAATVLLQIAAVAGRRFDFSLLAQVSDHSEAELLDLIGELVDADFVVEASAEQFAFRHALTQEAVYARILRRRRQALHLSIGESMEQISGEEVEARVPDLAYHYHQAKQWQPALAYARQAGERALALDTPAAAVDHFTYARETVRRLAADPDPALYSTRGEAYETLGYFERAEADFSAALNAARAIEQPWAEWEALLNLGLLWSSRDYEHARNYFEEALEVARMLDEPASIARTLNRLGNWYANAQRNQQAQEHHEQALTLYEELEDRRGIAESLDLLGLVHLHRADMLQVSRSFERAASLFRQLGERRRLASSLAMLIAAAVPNYFHDLAAFPPGQGYEEAIDEVLAVAGEIGWRAAEAGALFRRAITAGYRGAYGRALPAAQQALAISEEIGHRQWTAENHYGLGVLALDLLALPRAGDHLEQPLELAEQINSVLWTEIVAPSLARVYLRQDKSAAATSLLEDTFEPEPPMKTLQQRGYWAVTAELLLEAGDPEAALAIANRLVATAPHASENGNKTIPRLGLLRGRILSVQQKFADAEDALEAALAGARQQAARPLQWRIHLALGNLYREQGQGENADHAFGKASEIIRSLAKTIPDGQLRDQFLGGAFIQLPHKYTPEAEEEAPGDLTPRQQEVAWHVAQGKSNKAIADELVLSVRTVEDHVSNILKKLDFSSRTEIAAWAVEHELDRVSH